MTKGELMQGREGIGPVKLLLLTLSFVKFRASWKNVACIIPLESLLDMSTIWLELGQPLDENSNFFILLFESIIFLY